MVLGMVVLVWLAAAVLTWLDTRHELDELLDSHLAQAAALLVVQQARDLGDNEEDDNGVDAPSLHRYAPKVAFQVFHEGRLVLRSANAPSAPMFGAEATAQRGFTTATIAGEPWRVFAARGAEGDVQVYVGEAMDSRAAILRAVLRSALLPMALGLPLLGLAVWWAVRRGMAPLRRLSRQLAARRPDALGPVALADAPAEMAPMVDALNALLDRIGQLLTSERRFTADAAHELRTPIAAIRAQAQVALGETDDTLRRHALRQTLEGCDRATRLVEQLLTLARVEAAQEGAACGTAAPTSPGIDMAALARRVLAELAPKALAKQQTLALDATGPAPLAGNETLLSVLLRNLVDNALRYSPPGANVHVRVEFGADGLSLHVEDSGPGLSDADRARLGERFFSVLGSGESGSGLGWSIVRRIAAVHGLKVVLGRSESLGGLAVTLSAPFPPRP
jgi:two-component system, OmpR family, sensor histidine kinase QseC